MIRAMQETILRLFQSLATPGLDRLAEAVTMLGEEDLTIIVATYIYWNLSKKTGFRLTAVFTFSTILNLLVKISVRAPRPFQVLASFQGKRLATATGYSFPSGHSQAAATLFTIGALLFRRWWAVLAAVLAIPLVGLSRIYLGVHWPVDVLVGIILGVASTLLLWKILCRREEAPGGLGQLVPLLAAGVAGAALLLLLLDGIFFHGAVDLKDFFKIAGAGAGFFGGFALESRRLGFDARRGRTSLKALRYCLGLFGAAALLLGLKLLLPDGKVFAFLRYGAVGFWAAFLWPLIGMRMGLFSREPDSEIQGGYNLR